MNNTNVHLVGNSKFTRNLYNCEYFCVIWGSAVAIFSSNLTFTGNATFFENGATYSGKYHTTPDAAIYASGNTVLGLNGTSNFINNSVGNAIFCINFNGNSTFISNSANQNSGAIFASGNTALSFSGTTNFINNFVSNFINNSYHYSGGDAIYASDNTVFSFNGTSNFISNMVVYSGGGAIYASDNTTLNFNSVNGTSNFINSSANGGGSICAVLTVH